MAKLVGLTVDVGGSEVRFLPQGETDVRNPVILSNDFKKIEKADFRVKSVEDTREVVEFLEAPKVEYLGIYARGAAGRLYDGENVEINSQAAKTSSTDYYRQFLFAVAVDAYNRMVTSQCKDDYEYVISTCIPIKEHNSKQDCVAKLKSRLSGHYRAVFPMATYTEVTFDIKPDNIGVLPEGAVCVSALRKELKDGDFSVVIDMGHVSTDISLFKGRSLFGNRTISSPYAGSTLVAMIRMALIDEGYNVSVEQARECLETGVTRIGAASKPVDGIIEDQIHFFIKNYIKPEIIQLLNTCAINIQQVANIIPVGAPMRDKADGRTSLIIKTIAKECGFENVTVKRVADNLQFANIVCASTFTDIMFQSRSCV